MNIFFLLTLEVEEYICKTDTDSSQKNSRIYLVDIRLIAITFLIRNIFSFESSFIRGPQYVQGDVILKKEIFIMGQARVITQWTQYQE